MISWPKTVFVLKIRSIFLYKLTIITFLSVLVMNQSNAQCNFTDGPLGEICTTAEYICGSKLDGYVGRLRTKNVTEVFWNNALNNPKAGVCGNAGQFDNTSWFSFTACSKIVHLRIHFYNSVHPFNNIGETGIQTGLYSECRRSSSVACEDAKGKTFGTINLQYNNFVPGQLVYFVLDGWDSSVCDFRIEVVEGLDTTPVVPPDASALAEGYITGPVQIACSNKYSPIVYSLLESGRAINFSNSCAPPTSFNPIDSVCFSWTVSPSTGRNFYNQDSTGKSVKIVFTEPGVYTINAETNFNPFYVGSCANAAAGKINSWTVTVLPENIVDATPEFVCPGDTRVYCGQTITKDTLIICDEDPCNIIRQKFIFGTSKVNTLPTQYVCEGGVFVFQGISYTDPGDYRILDEQDCSLVHVFTIIRLDLNVDIQSSVLTINCLQPVANASAEVNAPSGSKVDYQWYNQRNELVGSNENLNINQPGIYTLNVTVTTSSGSCYSTKQIRIDSDFNIPKITASIPLVRCKFLNEHHSINVSPLSGYQSLEWETPTGVKSNNLNIAVDSLNAATGRPYKLKIIGDNGCTLDTSFVLKINFEKAEINLTGDDLTCYMPSVIIEAKTNISIDSIRWNKISPDQKFYGSHLTKLTHEVKEPGVYRVDAMASASKCWNSETIAILDKMIYPEFSFGNSIKWHCNTTSIDIKPITSSDTSVHYIWSSKDGNIVSEQSSLNMTAGSPGIYRLMATDQENGCSKIEDLIIEEELNRPNLVSIETDDVLCYGEKNGQLIIRNVQGGFGPYSYFIDNNQIYDLSIDDLQSGVYNLEVRDNYDCALSKQFTIGEPVTFQIQTDQEITIGFNESAVLSFTSNYSHGDIASIVWTDSNNNVLGTDFEIDYTTNYPKVINLEVTTYNGCVSRGQIRVLVDNELKVYFPNIFSPNGDGVNDRLVILKNKIPAQIHKVSIYDRYGNMVYIKDTFDFELETDGWDGTFRGNQVLPGVYIMIVEVTDFAGKRQILKQDLTLIR